MTTPILRVIGISTFLSLALAACGGDSDSTADTGPPRISTTATDFAFLPDAWAVSTGEGITFTMGNEGSVVHTFVILDSTIENEDEFAKDKVIWEAQAESGESVEQVIDVSLEPGTYQVICSIDTHFDLGMEGELVVGS